MKSSEFHRFIQINGWKEIRQAGSHIIYEKNGKQVTVPYHGSKEMKKGLVMKIKKTAMAMISSSPVMPP